MLFAKSIANKFYELPTVVSDIAKIVFYPSIHYLEHQISIFVSFNFLQTLMKVGHLKFY